MATSAGEIEVKLTLNADDFKRGLTQGKTDAENFNQVITDLGKRLLAVFSFTEIANFFKQSLNAYAENELAITRLTAALRNQGLATQKTIDGLTNMATALEYQTGTSDEAIISAETLLTTFGIQGETMQKVTQAALDLSAATGTDLQRSALLLGKAFEGETGTLSRYGVVVNSHLDLNKRFAAVMDQVNDRFGGMAQAQAQTYTGKLNILKESINDLQEAVGKFLSGPGGKLVTWLTEGAISLTSFLKEVHETTSGWRSFVLVVGTLVINVFEGLVHAVLSLLGAMTTLLSKIPGIGVAFNAITGSIQKVNSAWSDQMKFVKAALAAILESEPKKQAAVEQTGQVIYNTIDAVSTFTKDKMDEEMKLRIKNAEELKAAHMEFAKSFITTEGEMWQFATSMGQSFIKGIGDGFAHMVVAGKNFSESMKAIFKDMAIQIISYIVQMIIKLIIFLALREAARSFGGVYGTAIAGAMTASANASSWGGEKMAEGGMINEPSILTGLRSGSQHLVGEAGPEAVVPMNNKASPGSMDSGGITINISGHFLEGDAASWTKLMREKIMPSVRRYTMVNPTGNFNRKRGVA